MEMMASVLVVVGRDDSVGIDIGSETLTIGRTEVAAEVGLAIPAAAWLDDAGDSEAVSCFGETLLDNEVVPVVNGDSAAASAAETRGADACTGGVSLTDGTCRCEDAACGY